MADSRRNLTLSAVGGFGAATLLAPVALWLARGAQAEMEFNARLSTDEGVGFAGLFLIPVTVLILVCLAVGIAAVYHICRPRGDQGS